MNKKHLVGILRAGEEDLGAKMLGALQSDNVFKKFEHELQPEGVVTLLDDEKFLEPTALISELRDFCRGVRAGDTRPVVAFHKSDETKILGLYADHVGVWKYPAPKKNWSYLCVGAKRSQ